MTDLPVVDSALTVWSAPPEERAGRPLLVLLHGYGADERDLFGLVPYLPSEPVVAGSHLFAEGATQETVTDQGWITSACFSPHVGSSIGLGFLADGASRRGEVIVAANPIQNQSVRLRVVSAHFVDPEGERLRA